MVFKKQNGFTVIELMIATGVFSVAIMLITAGVIFVGRQYQQASTRVALENASREIHQQVGQSIQFSADDPINSSVSSGWISTCIGAQRYTYNASAAAANPSYTTSSYNNLKAGLYVDDIVPAVGSCSVLANPASSGSASNMLPSSAIVTRFYFTGGNLTTNFTSSSADLLNLTSSPLASDQIHCKGGIAGKEYCAVVQLSSTANKRVTN